MRFYPVYRICRTAGTFTRVGSFLESARVPARKNGAARRAEAQRVFGSGPGETILVGPGLRPGDRRNAGLHRLPD